MVEEVNIKISGEGAKKAKVTTTRKKAQKKKTPKKTQRKKVTKKKAPRKKRASPQRKNPQVEKILIENFISMQKVMTGMAEKFDNLSKQISKLLKLFEDSAETLVEKDINLQLSESEDQEEVLSRLNRILDQNKIIAKGLTLMHETAVNPTTYYSLGPNPEITKQSQMTPQKPISPMPPMPPMPQPNQKMTMSKEIDTSNTFRNLEKQQGVQPKQKVFEEENNFSGF